MSLKLIILTVLLGLLLVRQFRQPSTGGYDLGFYLCHQIVRTHGVRIQMTSQTDARTAVSFNSPMLNKLNNSNLSMAIELRRFAHFNS